MFMRILRALVHAAAAAYLVLHISDFALAADAHPTRTSIDRSVLASVEYAAEHLHYRVLAT